MAGHEDSINPYASPKLESNIIDDGAYFGLATKRLSFREYWWLAKNPIEFMFGILFKVCRINLAQTFGMAHPSTLRRVLFEEIPEPARSQLLAVHTQAQDHGFEPCFCYTIPHLGRVEAYASVLRSSDGEVVLGIAFARNDSGPVPQEVCKFYLSSHLQNGRVLATLGGKPDLDTPSEVSREALIHKPFSVVLAHHRQRIRDSLSMPILFRDAAQVEEMIRRRETHVFDFHCQRGVFVPLDTAILQKLAGERNVVKND